MDEPAPILRPEPPRPAGPTTPASLPPDLLAQAAGRLRILALLYAFTFFMAAVFPLLVVSEFRGTLFEEFVHWGVSGIAILIALVVAFIAGSGRVPLSAVMTLGLWFEVVGSYGIAAAELLPGAPAGPNLGLSWVAAWTILFTVVVPARPSRALVAALASVSAVPVIAGITLASGLSAYRPSPAEFFFGLVLPYLLVVGMAWVGSRVVYGLGTELVRARQLGSYVLEERLGEGGMGEVWRARHRLLARPAAIKLIRPALMSGARPEASEAAVVRFEREARAIAHLRSPHTVELYDFGVAAGGTFYYVMEYLEGLDAERLVREHGPMPAARAVHVLRQVCHSLSEAESAGLVHRDIKPANVFLCHYGEEYDFVKVLDFGIVRAVREPPVDGRALTGDNAVQGTPAYMAPEQAMGREVDARTDIYATGCVAYWLLTGEPVFDAPTPMAVLVDHASTPPSPPSGRAPYPVPPSLDALVLACLAKDPAGRPQAARELARRLAEVPGADDWTQDLARTWWEAATPAARVPARA